MSEQTRRLWRRRLLVAGLAPLLLALLLAGKVGAMTFHDREGRSSYQAGDFAAARSSFAQNAALNVVQRWVSPYDEGTARYRLGNFAGAVRSLEEALQVVPPEHACLVRINLALAHEALGDAAASGGDVAAAEERWSEGVDVLVVGRCLEPVVVDVAQVADAQVVDMRLRGKLADVAEDPETEDAEPREQARTEELADRTERAEERRRKAEQRRQDREDEQDSPDGEMPTYAW